MRVALERAGRRLAFFDRFDAEARAFEDALRAAERSVAGVPWPRLAHRQSRAHLESSRRRFVVLQLEGADGRRCQLAAQERASRLPGLSAGAAGYWTPDLEPAARDDQRVLLEAMAELCRARTGWSALRLHAYLPGDEALREAETLMREAGFASCEPQAPERTRLVDLSAPLPELLARFPGKTRRWLAAPDPARASIAELKDRGVIPALETALGASFSRSTGEAAAADFEALFGALERRPESVILLGFFLSESPGAPPAFVSAEAHGPVFEYTAAGSVFSEALRRHPFNYALLWRMIELAKARGARLLDLGGVTSQEPGDPLAGITHFKRRFPGEELAVGREGLLTLRPGRARVLGALRAVKKRLGRA